MILVWTSYRKQDYMSKKSNKYTAKVLEICDNGDAIIELPTEMTDEIGWKVGDTLDISEKNGLIYIKNLTKGENDVSVT